MATVAVEVIEKMKKQVDEKGFLDVGKGAEEAFGVSRDKFQTAVSILKSEGYGVYTVAVSQSGTENEAATKVLVPAGTAHEDVVDAFSEKPKHAAIVPETEPIVEPVSEEEPAPVETESAE